MKIKEAKYFIKLFLKLTGYKGITMPWKTIYLLPSHLNDAGLIAHEKVHVEQIVRLGPFKFTFLYLWYNLKYGYWDNPLEVEARTLSGYS